jgi:Mor family transcriptional regulator
MSKNLAFCYAVLLKNPQTITAQVALVADERRSEIEALMKDLGAVPQADLRWRWQNLRKTEIEITTRDCIERYGHEFRAFSPRLQNWLSQAF